MTEGATVRFVPLGPPPPGFNPTEEAADELIEYGLPLQPNKLTHPKLHDFWGRMFSTESGTTTFIKAELEEPPQFQIIGGGHFPDVNNRRSISSSRRTRRQSSSNWSGAYIRARDGLVFTEIHGAFRVPVVELPQSAELDTLLENGDQEFRCSTWIGFDGQRRYHHSSLPQIGTAQFFEVNSRGPANFGYEAWVQWWDRDIRNDQRKLMGFEIQPGDWILCSIYVEQPPLAGLGASSKREWAKFIIKNERTGVMVAPFFLRSPAGAKPPLKISGATAEWITERPSIHPFDNLYAFPKYQPVEFENCVALATSLRGGLNMERTLDGSQLINMRQIQQEPLRSAKISVAEPIDSQRFRTVFQGI